MELTKDRSERRRELLRLKKEDLANLILEQQKPDQGAPLRFAICVRSRAVFAREVGLVREPGAVLCRSMIQLPEDESVRPIVMIGQSAADLESSSMDVHQIRFQSGFACKIRFLGDLYSVTLLRDRNAVWYSLWVNYDGPAEVAWEDWIEPEAQEDVVYQKHAAAIQNLSESA